MEENSLSKAQQFLFQNIPHYPIRKWIPTINVLFTKKKACIGSSLPGTGSTQKIVLAELISVGIYVAPITQLRTCVIKIVTFKGDLPMW